jgi:hypothetical protein
MKNPDNQNLGCGGNVVIDDVALEWVFSQIRSNVFAANAERRRIGQPAKRIVHPLQIMFALLSAPLLFRESGDISQVGLGGVGERK